MRGQLAGCSDRVTRIAADRGAKGRLDGLGRQAAGAQQRGRVCQRQDRAFHAHGAGAVVQHGGDAARQAVEDMLRGCGADAARHIGRGGGDGHLGGVQQGLCRGMLRHAYGHGLQPGGDQRRQAVTARQRQHKCQGTGPEGGGQSVGGVGPLHQRAGRVHIRHMHDQRVEAGAALRGVDACHCLPVARVCAQPVHCLCRKSDLRALSQQGGGAGDAVGIGVQVEGFGLVHVIRA